MESPPPSAASTERSVVSSPVTDLPDETLTIDAFVPDRLTYQRAPRASAESASVPPSVRALPPWRMVHTPSWTTPSLHVHVSASAASLRVALPSRTQTA